MALSWQRLPAECCLIAVLRVAVVKFFSHHFYHIAHSLYAKALWECRQINPQTTTPSLFPSKTLVIPFPSPQTFFRLLYPSKLR